MAKFIKNQIGYVLPVEEVNRKFARRADSCAVKQSGLTKVGPKSWIGAYTYKASRGGLGIVGHQVVICRKYARTSPVSASELETRSLFTNASKITQAQLKDLMQMAAIQAKATEAMNNPSKRMSGVSAAGMTWRGWVFAVNFARLKAGDTPEQVATFPNAFDA